MVSWTASTEHMHVSIISVLSRLTLPVYACRKSSKSQLLHVLLFMLQGVQGISDIITIPGLVNVDFADVKSIMCNSGTAMLGVGVSTGKNRAEEAAMVVLDTLGAYSGLWRIFACFVCIAAAAYRL